MIEGHGPLVEFKRSADGKQYIEGYAIEYHQNGKPETQTKIGKWTERVKQGSFGEYIRSGKPIPVVWNHDKAMELGRSDYPDCEVKEDTKGVYVRLEFDETDPTHQLVRSKQKKPGSRLGWSFHADGHHRDTKEGNEYIRTIHTIGDVKDISVVMRPAYSGPTVYIRSEDEAGDDVAIAKLEKKLAIVEHAKKLRAAIDRKTAQ